MPTTPITTFTNGQLEPHLRPAELDFELPINLVDGVYAAGTVLGQVTASGLFKPYAAGNGDGSQDARCILKYGCTVAGGKVTLVGSQGESPLLATAYFGGIFKTTDVVGLDAAGLADLGGRLLYGSIASGVFRF